MTTPCTPTDSIIDDDVYLVDVVAVVEHAGTDVLGMDTQIAYDEALEEEPK